MTTNLYTFNPFSGITIGISLVLNGINPRNKRPVPPHIACGHAFVAVEKHWKQPPLDRYGRLLEASLHLIEPLSGRMSFEVLVPQHEQESNLYCLVDSSTPKGVKLKAKPEEVKARYALKTSKGVRQVIWDKTTQSYLLGFNANDAEANVWYETGHIARIVRRGNGIIQIPLTAKEIAKERVCQFKEQILELQDGVEADQRRWHGIIAGAVRLLRITSNRDAEDILVGFLVEQLQHMTENLRQEIHDLLLAKKHFLAGNFVEGWTTNIVPLKSLVSLGAGKAKYSAAKRFRSERDRETRLAAKGASGGKGGKQK